MAKRQQAAKTNEIPAWLMTYSDVITLLMTFFILLLTFATSEPEMFERMQRMVFGDGAADGMAGPELDEMEKNSWVIRMRPRTARHSTVGSEIPPSQTDPLPGAVEKTLAAVDIPEPLDLTLRYAVDIPIDMLVSTQGKVLPHGQQLLHVLAQQLRRLQCDVEIQTCNEALLNRIGSMASHLVDQEHVIPNQVSVSVVEDHEMSSQLVRLRLDWCVAGERS